MKRINTLSSTKPSSNKLSEAQIKTFNDKMREVAIQVANNSRRANESAAKVMLTR